MFEATKFGSDLFHSNKELEHLLSHWNCSHLVFSCSRQIPLAYQVPSIGLNVRGTRRKQTSCPHGAYSSRDWDNEQAHMKCHMATHIVENNQAEEKARSAVWRVLAGLQACKESSGEASKKLKKVRKQGIQTLGRALPEGTSQWRCAWGCGSWERRMRPECEAPPCRAHVSGVWLNWSLVNSYLLYTGRQWNISLTGFIYINGSHSTSKELYVHPGC